MLTEWAQAVAYLNETDVRRAARDDYRVAVKKMDAGSVLKESALAAGATDKFDVFLCHSIRDAELVLGAKRILESQKLAVYVDWIVDPQMDRSSVTAGTAQILRSRMRQSRSLMYIYSNSSKRSRWMPWELGYFDGSNGTVGILPIAPDLGLLNFGDEEYLGLYPKIELANSTLFVNRTTGAPVRHDDHDNYCTFETWVTGFEKLRP